MIPPQERWRCDDRSTEESRLFGPELGGEERRPANCSIPITEESAESGITV